MIYNIFKCLWEATFIAALIGMPIMLWFYS